MPVDRERFGQPGPRARVIAAPQLEEAEIVQHKRRIDPASHVTIDLERLAVPGPSFAVIALGARHVAQIDESHGGGLGQTVGPAQGKRLRVGLPRPAEIAQELGNETEVVLVRRHAAHVPDPLPDGESLRVHFARALQIAPILADACENPQGIHGRAPVAGRFRQPTRLVEVGLGAVQVCGAVEPRPDVPERGGHPRGVRQRRAAPIALAPVLERRGHTRGSEGRVTGPPETVGGHLCVALGRRPCGELTDLPKGEGVGPHVRIGPS